MENEVNKEMTPQEKAEELIKMFIDIETTIKWVDSQLNGDNVSLGIESKKEWAEDYSYWAQVKSELEKLK
jgi:hypothetical protein